MFTTAKLYASANAHLIAAMTKDAAKTAAAFTSDHKSEIGAAAASGAVFGLAGRVAGFKAGYAFAKNGTPTAQ